MSKSKKQKKHMNYGEYDNYYSGYDEYDGYGGYDDTYQRLKAHELEKERTKMRKEIRRSKGK